jgi:hypothetical protein
MDGGIGSVLPARQHRCVLWGRVRRQAKCPSMCSIRIKDVSGRAHRRRHFRLCELDSGPSPEVDGITAARQLNQRPRVILGWQSPLEYLTRLVTPLTEHKLLQRPMNSARRRNGSLFDYRSHLGPQGPRQGQHQARAHGITAVRARRGNYRRAMKPPSRFA